ncbi:MAG TPA: YceI family protein [Acidimicrobiales bacterium]|jgi:polyisoprenoid-binding protein YceI|nr:YceI family protein [Acidimicrobiales bacterium]
MSTTTNTEGTITREVDGRQVPAPGTYAIDRSHSTVEFVARHLMITKVRGRFTEFEGQIQIAENPAESSAQVSIDTASVTTGDDGRDEHLRTADFFTSSEYPAMTFRTTGVEQAKGGDWKVNGELTIRDITKPVTLDVEFDGAGVDPWGGTRIAFTASTDVDREDWGLTWNQALEAGGVLVGKKVRLELAVQAVRQA